MEVIECNTEVAMETVSRGSAKFFKQKAKWLKAGLLRPTK